MAFMTPWRIPLCEAREVDMPWEKPSFREVNMSSEIGAYQEDYDERTPGDLTAGRPLDEQTSEASLQAGART
jgi:hypothetical protein